MYDFDASRGGGGGVIAEVNSSKVAQCSNIGTGFAQIASATSRCCSSKLRTTQFLFGPRSFCHWRFVVRNIIVSCPRSPRLRHWGVVTACPWCAGGAHASCGAVVVVVVGPWCPSRWHWACLLRWHSERLCRCYSFGLRRFPSG
jgi:hypothetical protein